MRTRKERMADAAALYDFLSTAPAAPERAELLLVLGNHELRVPDYAAALYARGAAPLVVCSGGFGKLTAQRWTEPEAVVFARRCEALGVPREHMRLEPRSTNTGENFLFTRALLEAEGIRPKTGLIVTKPYMAKRALATGALRWPELAWAVGTPAVAFADYFPGGPSDEELAVMVGDLQRLRVYADCGFQAPVEVPEALWAVYERLVADGFDGHVIR